MGRVEIVGDHDLGFLPLLATTAPSIIKAVQAGQRKAPPAAAKPKQDTTAIDSHLLFRVERWAQTRGLLEKPEWSDGDVWALVFETAGNIAPKGTIDRAKRHVAELMRKRGIRGTTPSVGDDPESEKETPDQKVDALYGPAKEAPRTSENETEEPPRNIRQAADARMGWMLMRAPRSVFDTASFRAGRGGVAGESTRSNGMRLKRDSLGRVEIVGSGEFVGRRGDDVGRRGDDVGFLLSAATNVASISPAQPTRFSVTVYSQRRRRIGNALYWERETDFEGATAQEAHDKAQKYISGKGWQVTAAATSGHD
jgi:hypothetical protein